MSFLPFIIIIIITPLVVLSKTNLKRSEERRVGKECLE